MLAGRTPTRSRTAQRTVHLLLAVALGVYVYSPLASIPTVELLVQGVVFPALALSGLWLWKGSLIRARLRRFRSAERGTAHGTSRAMLALVGLTLTFGFGHHVDHVVRGNHVGWPLTPEVNAFTVSLLSYPVVLLGLYLGAKNRAGPRYWTGVFAVSAVLVVGTHFGPTAVEPPADILGVYADPLAGMVALGWLVAFVAVLVWGVVYTGLQWRSRRTAAER